MNELINLGNGQFVKITMLKGEKGSNIATITKTATSGLTDTYTITLTDGSTTTFDVKNGSSIDHITKTSTVGAVDTYTIYLTDGTVGGTFEVNNAVATIDQNFSESSTNPLMNKTLTNIIAGVENGSTASKTYYENDIILRNDSLYMVTTTVATGTAWADGVNISEKTLGELIGGFKSALTANSKTMQLSYVNGKYGITIDGTFYELGGGGMPALDYANPLKTFDKNNKTWTTSNECWVRIYIGSIQGYDVATLTIDGTACPLGYTNDTSDWFHIRKGAVLSISANVLGCTGHAFKAL